MNNDVQNPIPGSLASSQTIPTTSVSPVAPVAPVATAPSVEDITPPDDLPASINTDKSPIIEEFMIEPKTEHIEAPVMTAPISTVQEVAPEPVIISTPVVSAPVAPVAPVESVPPVVPKSEDRTAFQVDTTNPLYEDSDQVKLAK